MDDRLSGLDDETRAVCAAWFGMMAPHKGSLSFAMVHQKPSDRAAKALDRLVEHGVVKRIDGQGTAIEYVPLVDCSPLLGWFQSVHDDDRFRFPLTQKLAPGSKAGFTITLAG